MKILKLFIAVITLLCVSAMTPSAEAGPFSDIDYALTDEMNTHPENFLAGGSAGTSAFYSFIKRSIQVEEYAPPYYTISIDEVLGYVSHEDGQVRICKPCRVKYHFNWETKKAYEVYTKADGSQEFVEIKRNYNNKKSAANDIFKLAYNMDFFSPDELK